MTKRSITSLVIKLAAICAIAISLPNLISYFTKIYYGGGDSQLYTMMIGSTLLFALLMIFYLFLICSSDWFANKLIVDDESFHIADKISADGNNSLSGMTKRSITSLIIKLAAIYVLTISLPELIFYFGQIYGLLRDVLINHRWSNPLIYGSTLLFMLMSVFYIFIIRSSDWFATKLIVSDGLVIKTDNISKDEIYSIAFSFVGLLVLSTSIPSFVNSVSRIVSEYHYTFHPGALKEIYLRFFPSLMSQSTEILVGLYIFLFPKSLLTRRNRILTR